MTWFTLSVVNQNTEVYRSAVGLSSDWVDIWNDKIRPSKEETATLCELSGQSVKVPRDILQLKHNMNLSSELTFCLSVVVNWLRCLCNVNTFDGSGTIQTVTVWVDFLNRKYQGKTVDNTAFVRTINICHFNLKPKA